MGESQSRLVPVKLDALVSEVQREVLTGLENRQIAWKINPLPTVYADHVLLRQVFMNLLSNAVKFTRLQPAAEIEIGSQPGRAGEVTIFVKDNGVGFNMEYVNKLFEVFRRLHSQRAFEGTGVGLAMVRQIIHRFGGSVWAEGRENQGATFYITLKKDESNKGAVAKELTV
jgi:light-regulated signal transduction histidine kinase (bacteriophytochrome)